MREKSAKLIGYTLAVLSLFGGGNSPACGQVLRLSSFPTANDEISSVVVRAASNLGPIEGWSFSVCHDPALANLIGIDPLASLSGLTPAFEQIQVLPEGVTVEVLLASPDALPSFADLYQLEYEPLIKNSSLLVEFCDDLTNPPVEASISSKGQLSTPELEDEVVFIGDVFRIVAPQINVSYFLGDNMVEFPARVQIEQVDPTNEVIDSCGFSLGVVHDETILEVLEVNPAGVIASINGGDGPDFFVPSILPNGWTAGVVTSFNCPNVQFPSLAEVIEVTYRSQPGVLGSGTSSPLEIVNGLGAPPVESGVVAFGLLLETELTDGLITLAPVTFRRGDTNDDGLVNIGDVIDLLNYLFASGPLLACLAATDTNLDGGLNIADAVYLFTFLFDGTAPPPAPFPDCGVDNPTLDCQTSSGCP